MEKNDRGGWDRFLAGCDKTELKIIDRIAFIRKNIPNFIEALRTGKGKDLTDGQLGMANAIQQEINALNSEFGALVERQKEKEEQSKTL